MGHSTGPYTVLERYYAMNSTTLINCLHNLAPSTGTSLEYQNGIVVGLVAGLMASGKTWRSALAVVKRNLPTEYSTLAFPETWRGDLSTL